MKKEKDSVLLNSSTPPLARACVFVSAVALLDAENRILLAQRPVGKSMAGLWEFPGGKVEAGETPEAALVREIQEELSLTLDARDLDAVTFVSHAYEKFHLLMVLYLCRRWTGEVFPRENQEIQWVSVADMAEIPMPPADLPLVDALSLVIPAKAGIHA